MQYTFRSFVIQLRIGAILALLPFLTISTKSTRQRDYVTFGKYNLWHNFVRTDQHVPGNNVEAALDRLILVLNNKIFSVSVKWHLAAIHLYQKTIPRHVAQTGKTQMTFNAFS